MDKQEFGGLEPWSQPMNDWEWGLTAGQVAAAVLAIVALSEVIGAVW